MAAHRKPYRRRAIFARSDFVNVLSISHYCRPPALQVGNTEHAGDDRAKKCANRRFFDDLQNCQNKNDANKSFSGIGKSLECGLAAMEFRLKVDYENIKLRFA
jgi:hypothetical protein